MWDDDFMISWFHDDRFETVVLIIPDWFGAAGALNRFCFVFYTWLRERAPIDPCAESGCT